MTGTIKKTSMSFSPLETKASPQKQKLLEIFDRLYAHFGPQFWWPAETPFEVMIGAILTQNTSWKNVEKAISALKDHDLLHPEPLYHLPEKSLSSLIRPSGYFNLKARRIKALLDLIYQHYGGSLEAMFSEKWETLKVRLLSVKGIGPETADAILLYAGKAPVFVIDAYTRRIFERHGHIQSADDYDKVQGTFMEGLWDRTDLYNEYHALIVMTGKQYCKKIPDCAACPLNDLLEGKAALKS